MVIDNLYVYIIKCICIDIIYMSSNNRQKKTETYWGDIFKKGIVNGLVYSIVIVYIFISIIFIHKGSQDPDTLEMFFPTNHHENIITTWFMGRLISEVTYKTIDANNRNVQRFLKGLSTIDTGPTYILLMIIVGGMFSLFSSMWLIYGVVITFGQAFIFNMTLPVGWIRSFIILWFVGLSSLL
jgi:hypothetical protein